MGLWLSEVVVRYTSHAPAPTAMDVRRAASSTTGDRRPESSSAAEPVTATGRAALTGRWDGRCCTRARCVITEHLGGRRKSPVWSTEAIYILGSTAGVPEERSAALIYAGAPV
jgi:hypothetical protein